MLGYKELCLHVGLGQRHDTGLVTDSRPLKECHS